MHKYLTPSYLTKPGALVLCLSLLVGCTSVQQRKDWSQKKFGPRCESVGYKADTPAYLECIADEDRERHPLRKLDANDLSPLNHR